MGSGSGSSCYFGFARALQLFLVVWLSCGRVAWADSIGVCYGTDADNLPTPTQAVALLNSLGVGSARIFDSNTQIIQAFADSGIDLGITLTNDQIVAVALSQNTSDAWVAANVLPFVPATNITSISIGSEVLFQNSGNISVFLVPAMQNIYTSLRTVNLVSTIKVVTSNAMNVLQTSFPPSAGAFNSSIVGPLIVPLLQFLSQTRSPFYLNSYPYYAYVNDPNGVPLSYALFSSTIPVVDSNNNLQYNNLFDAQIDALYAAMGAVNFTDIEVVVAESGWPSRGDANEIGASTANAHTYNQNLIDHIKSAAGTPLKPGIVVQTYLFSLYNEDLKTGPSSERNFGIYNADSTPVYSLNFQGTSNSQSVYNRTWCVARADASNSSLLIALNYACGQARVNCRPIQNGGDCFLPNTYNNHASYAFNEYYQDSNMDPRACNFSNTAALTSRDPSYGNCEFYSKNPNSASMLWQELARSRPARAITTVLLLLVLLLEIRIV